LLDAILRAQAEGRAVGVPVDPKSPRTEVHDAQFAQCFSQGMQAD
jgi:hypothetical protein